VGCLASWDSSAHNSLYLNRVTQEQERLFLTVRVTVRIRDPLPLDLMLRKRICFSVYKRQSFVSRFKKTLGYSAGHLLKGLGVTYELVGSVPMTFGDETLGRDTVDKEQDEQDEGQEEESFFDEYAQAVTAVETILSLERLRQEDLVLELAARNETVLNSPAVVAPRAELMKTLSIPNFGGPSRLGGASSAMSLNLMGRGRGLSGSLASLNVQDSRRSTGGSRRSLGPPAPSLMEENSRKRLSLPSGAVGRGYLAKNGGNALRKSMVTLQEEDGGGEKNYICD
jgi:kinesin family protein 13